MKKDKYSGKRMRELGLAWGGDGVEPEGETRQTRRRESRIGKKNPTLYRGYPEPRHERRRAAREQAKQDIREGIKAVYASLPKPTYTGIGRGIKASRSSSDTTPSGYIGGVAGSAENLIPAFERLGVSAEEARKAVEQFKAHHGQVMDESR